MCVPRSSQRMLDTAADRISQSANTKLPSRLRSGQAPWQNAASASSHLTPTAHRITRSSNTKRAVAKRGVGIARLVVMALGPGLVFAEVAAARVLSASPSRRLLSFADRPIRYAAGDRVRRPALPRSAVPRPERSRRVSFADRLIRSAGTACADWNVATNDDPACRVTSPRHAHIAFAPAQKSFCVLASLR